MENQSRSLKEQLTNRYFAQMVSVAGVIGALQCIFEIPYRRTYESIVLGLVASFFFIFFPLYSKWRPFRDLTRITWPFSVMVITVLHMRLLSFGGFTGADALWLLLCPLYAVVFADSRTIIKVCLYLAVTTALSFYIDSIGGIERFGLALDVIHSEDYQRYSFLFPFAALLIFVISYGYHRSMVSEMVTENEAKMVMWSKLASLGELAAGVSHEINNPLTIIKGYIKILRRKYEDGDCSAQEIGEYFDRCEDSVERIVKIIKALKSLSRVEAASEKERIPFLSVWEEVRTLCSQPLGAAEVELILIDELAGTPIEVHPTQLLQVLVNLIHNAKDAISHLEERWVKVHVKVSGERDLKIMVQDSGPGIDKKVAEMIFMPFYTTKEVGKGTGLGLSLSLRLIKEHGGELYYEKVDGHTTFIITLPAAVIV